MEGTSLLNTTNLFASSVAVASILVAVASKNNAIEQVGFDSRCSRFDRNRTGPNLHKIQQRYYVKL